MLQTIILTAFGLVIEGVPSSSPDNLLYSSSRTCQVYSYVWCDVHSYYNSGFVIPLSCVCGYLAIDGLCLAYAKGEGM